MDSLQSLWQQYGDQALGYAVNVVGVLVLLFIAWMAAGWTRRTTRRGLERAGIDATLTKFFANLARYLVLIAAVLAALGVFGVDTTSFAAVLAAAGFAIGMALQGTLSNFSAGVMLLTFRPFKVGDVVSVGGVTGKVNEIELFTTTLDTPDNRRIIVPNGTVFGSTIENITFHPIRRVDVVVGTDYGADLARAREVLDGVARQHHVVDDKEHQILLTGLGESSIDWQVRVWCKTEDYFAAKDALTHAVKDALDAAGIGIPFPQRDVHIDGSLGGA
ncbi:MAG: mechanosensitive ion channel [Acidobacteriota bacterium]|jgi:small conductance mechanosensitive channel